MANAFSLTSVRAGDRNRIYLTATGDMDSAAFVDGYIVAMDDLGEPWRFDRVIDLTACEGHVEFDDFVRLGKYWAPLMHFANGPVKTAVVTLNPRTEGRMPVVAMLLEGHHIKSFQDIAAADAWLDKA